MAEPFDLSFEDAEPAAEPQDRRRVFTVSDLAAEVRALVEGTFGFIWLEGELSNCRLRNTGHLYFSLKDAGAQLRAVMFKGSARALKFKLEDGQHVLARGRLSVYDPKGEYQIVCGDIEPRGLGARQLALVQLKRRLQAEGVANYVQGLQLGVVSPLPFVFVWVRWKYPQGERSDWSGIEYCVIPDANPCGVRRSEPPPSVRTK